MTSPDAKLREVFDATRARYRKLYATLEGVSEEQARFRPAEGAWSIGELAHHVALSQGRVLGALPVVHVDDVGPRRDDLGETLGVDALAVRELDVRRWREQLRVERRLIRAAR